MTTLATAVSDLSRHFSGRLLLPEHPAWEAARRVHNGLVDKRPALVAQCLGSADIALAVRFAREHGLEIAVRGGGHNVGGRATVDGGVMIDLSSMQHVHVDPRARTARAAGGTLWGHFNRETQAHGLATTGGVISTTGVGGLTLGGGVGWLMPKYGLALDNLRSVEVVLADGRIVRAAADEHDDLFWAVRGGGGNFGVASSFEFGLHAVGPTVTGGRIGWPADKARDVLRHFRELAMAASDDMMLVAALLTGHDGTKLAAMGAGFFGRAADAEAALRPVKSFSQPLLDTIAPIPYAELNCVLDGAFPRGARNYWKSHLCERLSDDAIDVLIDRFARCPSAMGQILIESFHGALARVAPTATAYALRARSFNISMLSQWTNAADDAANIAWARESYAAIQPFAGARRYVNYLDQDDTGDSALAAAYGPNLPRLQSIKAKFDPDNMFHLNVNIPPKA
jgi:FAD/FMN-containing dehydrogenase